jgi:hypothetical protein
VDIIYREDQEKSEPNNSFRTKENVDVGLLGCKVMWICREIRMFQSSVLMMEAIHSSETVNIYQTTQCNTPEDSHLHTYHHENLKFHYIQKEIIIQYIIIAMRYS